MKFILLSLIVSIPISILLDTPKGKRILNSIGVAPKPQFEYYDINEIELFDISRQFVKTAIVRSINEVIDERFEIRDATSDRREEVDISVS